MTISIDPKQNITSLIHAVVVMQLQDVDDIASKDIQEDIRYALTVSQEVEYINFEPVHWKVVGKLNARYVEKSQDPDYQYQFNKLYNDYAL